MDVATATLAGRLAKTTATEHRKLVEGNLGLTALGSRGMSRQLSGGTETARTFQARFPVRIAGRSLRFSFPNYTNTGTSSAETSGANDITIRAAVHTAPGSATNQIIPLKFAGADTVTIKPDQNMLSDAINIDVPQGTNLYVVTYVTVTATPQKWPLTYYGLASRLEGSTTTDDTAATTGIASGSYGNGYLYGPTVLYGTPYSTARKDRHAEIGDSIPRGTSPTADDDGFNVITPLSQTSVVNICAFGETAAAFATIAGHRRRIALIDGCTSWRSSYGANDVKTNANTFTSVATALLGVWTIIYERLGIPGYQNTITPNTTSTDAWATVANQSTAASPYNNATRVAVNNWLRDGAPILNGAPAATGSSAPGTLRAGAAGHPLAGYFDAADAVESARDSGIWKPNYSFDGIHLQPIAYQAVRDITDWTKLGIV